MSIPVIPHNMCASLCVPADTFHVLWNYCLLQPPRCSAATYLWAHDSTSHFSSLFSVPNHIATKKGLVSNSYITNSFFFSACWIISATTSKTDSYNYKNSRAEDCASLFNCNVSFLCVMRVVLLGTKGCIRNKVSDTKTDCDLQWMNVMKPEDLNFVWLTFKPKISDVFFFVTKYSSESKLHGLLKKVKVKSTL